MMAKGGLVSNPRPVALFSSNIKIFFTFALFSNDENKARIPKIVRKSIRENCPQFHRGTRRSLVF